jgi:hypothetical protein
MMKSVARHWRPTEETMTKSKMSTLAAALGAGILAGVAVQPVQATAVVVDPVNFSVTVATDPGTFSQCGTASPCAGSSGPASGTIGFVVLPSDDPDGPFYSGSASATASGSSAPALLVSAAITAAELEPDSGEASPLTYSAAAGLTYFFELTQIAGTTIAGPIPVLMNGSSSLSTQLLGEDDMTMSSVSMMVTAATPSDDPNTNYSLSASNNSPFSQDFNIVPGVEYEVVMGALATAEVAATDDSTPSLSSTASIDPIFTISPDYASDFALTFSSGIGNSESPSAVPEPSTWATMLIGFGGLGAALRFRRNHASATA